MILTVLQSLGALAGFISAGWLIYDRIAKHSPSAFIVGRLYKDDWVHGPREVYLRVRNQSDRPLLVHVKGGRDNGAFAPALGHETEDIIHSIMDGETTIAIDGGESHDFVLMPPPNFEEIAPDNEITAEVWWEFAQPFLWRPRRRIRVSLSKRAHTQLIEKRTTSWVEE